MQEPLLGAEGPDYDTFPEKPPPSPGDRARVGALQNKRVFLATFAAVLGNFSFGYALVYTSPVIPALEHSLDPDLHLTKSQASWFGSVFTLGAAAGGLSAMILNDLLGRKLSIMFSAVPSAAGYALMAGAHGLWMLLLGRTLTGFAGGLTAACIPVYVSEIAPPGVRGALGATPQLMAVFGSLSLYALGLLLPWRWLAVAGEAPVLVMILLLSFMPNSPRFLLSRGRDEEALRALAWLRGTDADVQWEFEQIQDNVRRQPPKDDAAIVGAVRLLSVLIAALTMDLAGRKVLLFVSAAIMFAANLTLGLYIHFGPRPLSPNSTAGLESESWGDLAQPLAAPAGYLTLVPLLATMFFIMGRCGGGSEGQSVSGVKGWVMCPGWLEKGVSSSSVETDTAASSRPTGPQPASSSEQAMPWAGAPSPGCSCLRSCPCGPVVWPRGSACWPAGSPPSSSPSPSCQW
ncbi:hypothetical protein H8959_012704 [Pygathrix nigripes]